MSPTREVLLDRVWNWNSLNSMRTLVRLLIGSSLGLVSAFAIAAPTSFGNRVLEIPAPSGHVAISATAPTVFATIQNYMPPANRLLELYTTPSDADALAEEYEGEEEAAMERHFQLMTLHSSDRRLVSAAQFKALIEGLEEDAASSDLGRQVDEMASKGNAASQQSLGADLNLVISDKRVFGVYRREPWGTFFAAQSSASAGEDPSVNKFVSAGAFLLVDQKVVYVIAWSTYADAQDLAWTKRALGAWAQAIRAANPDQDS